MLSLEELAKAFRATLGPAPHGLERLGLGVEREQYLLLNLAGPGITLPLNDRQLVPPATNVSHPPASFVVRRYHSPRRCANEENLTQHPCRRLGWSYRAGLIPGAPLPGSQGSVRLLSGELQR